MANTFTAEKRTAFLALLERGETVKLAAENVGISHVTVNTWVKTGDKADANEEKKGFAKQYREIQSAEKGELTKTDFKVIREQAIRGERHLSMVQLKCMEQLEGRHEHDAKQDQEAEPQPTLADELAARRTQKSA